MEPNLKVSFGELVDGQNYQVFSFSGDFDKAGYSEVKEELNAAVHDFSLKHLVFDFEDLKFINSEGIGYLMEVHTHLVQRDRKLVIVGLNAHVADVFEAIGIKEIIDTFGTFKDFLNTV